MSAPRVRPPAGAGDDPIAGSALGHQPEALVAFQKLYGTLWSHGVLDLPTKELARIRNARIVDCVICKNTRFAGAREEGLSESILDQIGDFEASDLSPRQKAVLRFTDAFLSPSPEPDAALRREMLVHFKPAEIVELCAALAIFMGFSKIAVSLGGMPESLPVTAGARRSLRSGTPPSRGSSATSGAGSCASSAIRAGARPGTSTSTAAARPCRSTSAATVARSTTASTRSSTR
jgi:alkylhydroperoxidase family enzyme